MTIVEMLGQSGLLTILGMGVVFSFIIILIICMHALHAAVAAAKLDKVEAKKAVAPKSETKQQNSTDIKAIVAAISVAIREKEGA